MCILLTHMTSADGPIERDSGDWGLMKADANAANFRHLDTYRGIGTFTLCLLIGGAATVLWTGGNPEVCGGSPQCLLSSGDLGGFIHEAIALCLLLGVLGLLVVALRERRTRPERTLPSVLALIFVLATAAWGAALSTGALPMALAPGVLAMLALAAAALLWSILA